MFPTGPWETTNLQVPGQSWILANGCASSSS